MNFAKASNANTAYFGTSVAKEFSSETDDLIALTHQYLEKSNKRQGP